ncbi:VOC family protein [Staphylococcus xylosus]|uniref:VOC family protein n=1 Tax=Staphylococcus xylosus TaxID=1288 RepID=UPI000E68FB5D|nr:VOC family protein [Staphylococcus xylosus]RIM78089.1 VOC family protein [Staphylococcus xylosus]
MNFEVSPYFLITNNADELRLRLEKIFNAQTVYIQRVKDRPLEARENIDEKDLEKIDQCVILFGDIKLMIADDTENLPITKGNNVSLCLTFENVDDTKRIYDILVELGSEILEPFAPRFYTEGYGYIKDEFGIAYHLFTKRKN